MAYSTFGRRGLISKLCKAVPLSQKQSGPQDGGCQNDLPVCGLRRPDRQEIPGREEDIDQPGQDGRIYQSPDGQAGESFGLDTFDLGIAANIEDHNAVDITLKIQPVGHIQRVYIWMGVGCYDTTAVAI